MKIKIRKDDKVIVIAGKDKGKTGKVMRVAQKQNQVIISGVNMLKRHVRPNRDMPQGGIIDRESGIAIANVMFYCGKCGRGVRLGRKRLPDGTRMRYCKKCELEV